MYLPTMTNSEILAYLGARDLNEVERELCVRLESLLDLEEDAQKEIEDLVEQLASAESQVVDLKDELSKFDRGD